MKASRKIAALRQRFGGESATPRTVARVTAADAGLVRAVQRGLKLRFDGQQFVRAATREGDVTVEGPESCHPLQILRLVRMGRLALWRDTRGDYPELLVTAPYDGGR